MPSVLTHRQLTGLDESHLVTLPSGHRLLGAVAEAYAALKADAAGAGFTLAIASSYRSFSRQLSIWNGKASGARPVHDDSGRPVAMHTLSPKAQLHAILRFSALPGTSRHHWGTDMDIYDRAAVADDYQLQLSPEEVAPGGVFDPLHQWLDERMAAGESRGFYRPYALDRGGVAPERWHLSYAPLSLGCAAQCSDDVLCASWGQDGAGEGLLLRELVEAELPAILQRYVQVPDGWCELPRVSES